MSDTVKRLKKAYSEYISARQARYDELVDMHGRHNTRPHPEDVFDLHGQIVETIDREEKGVSECIAVRYND
jgi:hypothetical protein